MNTTRALFYDAVSDAHVDQLAESLKPADIDEMRALHGEDCDIKQIIYQSIRMSNECWAVSSSTNGDLIAIYGTSTVDNLPGMGIPWILATDKFSAYLKALLEDGRTILTSMAGQFTYLANYVDARNTANIRWIQHLGFTVYPAVPLGPFGYPFHLFDIGTRPDGVRIPGSPEATLP